MGEGKGRSCILTVSRRCESPDDPDECADGIYSSIFEGDNAWIRVLIRDVTLLCRCPAIVCMRKLFTRRKRIAY